MCSYAVNYVKTHYCFWCYKAKTYNKVGKNVFQWQTIFVKSHKVFKNTADTCSPCIQNVATTYTIVFMRLELKLFRQGEGLVKLLQECLAVFTLVEIFGLWGKQCKWVLLDTEWTLLCWYSNHHNLTKRDVIAIIHRLTTHTTRILQLQSFHDAASHYSPHQQHQKALTQGHSDQFSNTLADHELTAGCY